MKHDAVLAASEEAVRRVPDERGLVDRPAVLSKLFRGAAHTGRTELCQPNLKTNIYKMRKETRAGRALNFSHLTIPTRRDDVRVAGEGQKLGLKDVGRVSGVVP